MPELRSSRRLADAKEQSSKKEPAPVGEPPSKKPKSEKVKTEVSDTKEKDGDKEEKAFKEIEEGDPVPDLTLLDEDENEVKLKEATSKTKYLVLFAYPKASTPGCTRQVCGFQKNYDFLHSSDVTVFGLSADKPKAQKHFIEKQSLKYSLLSDPHRELIGILGAKKSPSGIKRSHWIFVDGILKVKKIQISPEASFTTAKEDIESFIGEFKDKSENGESEHEATEDGKTESG